MAIEIKTVPIESLKGFLCCWNGCTAVARMDPGADLPEGWVGILTFERELSPTTTTRDGVLCPEHANMLETKLKPIRKWLKRA
jgi:hypothetical protein